MTIRRALFLCVLILPLSVYADVVYDAINKRDLPFLELFSDLCKAGAITISQEQRDRYLVAAQLAVSDDMQECAKRTSRLGRLFRSHKKALAMTIVHGLLAGYSAYHLVKLIFAIKSASEGGARRMARFHSGPRRIAPVTDGESVRNQLLWKTVALLPLTVLSTANFTRSALRLHTALEDQKETEHAQAQKIHARIGALPCLA